MPCACVNALGLLLHECPWVYCCVNAPGSLLGGPAPCLSPCRARQPISSQPANQPASQPGNLGNAGTLVGALQVLIGLVSEEIKAHLKAGLLPAAATACCNCLLLLPAAATYHSGCAL